MRLVNSLLIPFILISFTVCISCNGKNQDKDADTESKEPTIITDIDELNLKIRENPYDHNLFIQRAGINFEKGEVAEAITDVQIALVLDSINPEYYVILAEYFLNLGMSGNARDALLKSISFNPGHVDTRIKLAQIYFYVQMYREAFIELQFLEDNRLANAESFFLKGLIFYETENIPEAVKAMRKALEYDRNYWQAHNYLGLIHLRQNDPLAVDYYETAIRLFPENLEIRLNAGLAYQEFNQPEKAIQMYDYIIETDSSIYHAFFNKGYVYLELLEDYPHAIAAFTKAIKLDPESYPAYYNRGFSYELMGNLAAAEADYRKALEIMPNYDLAVDGLNDVIDKQRGRK
jgi:tetratricopeptide (TPR) repeat protein